jgi:hypothetical protein
MKNIKYFLLSFLIIVLFPKYSFAQTREYEDWYLLPKFFYENCTCSYSTSKPLSLDLSPNDIHIRPSTICSESNNNNNFMYCVWDVAQRFETDTAIEIIGVSALFSRIYYGQMYGYLCITDDSLNVLRKVKLESCSDTIDGNIVEKDISDHYTELFFDTSIIVNGKFYVMVDNPKYNPLFPNDYNWDGSTDLKNRTLYKANLYSAFCWNHKDTILYRYTLFTAIGSNNYSIDSCSSSNSFTPGGGQVLYLFPILTDNTISDTSDTTIVDTTDSSSLVNIVDNYTFIFPNPANKEVNIQCSFRMQTLELFNEQGQKVNEWKVDSYHYLLNIEDYPKGNYIMKIKTKSGTTTKKVIVQ